MTSLVIIAVAWTALAAPTGMLIGRGLLVAEHRDQARRTQSPVPDYIPDELLTSTRPL